MANPIPVTWVEQIRDYFCGPATAAMILKGVGVSAPAGVVTDADWQMQLWADIEDITTGPSRPDDAKGSPGYLEEFDRQQCFLCPDGDEEKWFCWAAMPQALRDVLNIYLPLPQVMGFKRSSGFIPDDFLEALMTSIDKGMPAAVGMGDETHWVVVRGYKVGQSGQGMTIGGKNIYGFYVRDPQVRTDSKASGLDLIPIEDFIRELGLVGCGAVEDQDQMISIVRL